MNSQSNLCVITTLARCPSPAARLLAEVRCSADRWCEHYGWRQLSGNVRDGQRELMTNRRMYGAAGRRHMFTWCTIGRTAPSRWRLGKWRCRNIPLCDSSAFILVDTHRSRPAAAAAAACAQCCDVETNVSKLDCTRVHWAAVSVLAHRPWWQGLDLGLQTSTTRSLSLSRYHSVMISVSVSRPHSH